MPWRMDAPFFPDPASRVAPREVKRPMTPARWTTLRIRGFMGRAEFLRMRIWIKEVPRVVFLQNRCMLGA